MLLIYWALAVLFVNGTYGQSSKDQCLEIPPVANVSLQKLLGTWYAQEAGTPQEAAKRCLTYTNTVEIDNDGTVVVNIRAAWLEGKDHRTMDIKSYPIRNTSGSKIVWKNKVRYGWLVATDYTFCTWYICIPDHAERGIVFVTTKDKQPNKLLTEKAHESIEKAGYNLRRSPPFPVDRSGC